MDDIARIIQVLDELGRHDDATALTRYRERIEAVVRAADDVAGALGGCGATGGHVEAVLDFWDAARSRVTIAGKEGSNEHSS